MRSFYDYLVESTKEYRYRIRTVLTISEMHLDRIESVLQKYDLVSLDGPKKTIMQARPLDFSTMPSAEVFIIDAVTHIPISTYILQQEIKHVLNVPDSFIVVRSENDPLEIQADHALEDMEIQDIAASKNLRPASILSTDPNYTDYQTPLTGPIAGNEYTKKFLKYLAKVKADREIIVPVITKDSRRMFDYLGDLPIDPEYYKDSPLPKPMAVKPGTKVAEPAPVSNYGNFDDTIKAVSHSYANKDGDKILITAKKIS